MFYMMKSPTWYQHDTSKNLHGQLKSASCIVFAVVYVFVHTRIISTKRSSAPILEMLELQYSTNVSYFMYINITKKTLFCGHPFKHLLSYTLQPYDLLSMVNGICFLKQFLFFCYLVRQLSVKKVC